MRVYVCWLDISSFGCVNQSRVPIPKSILVHSFTSKSIFAIAAVGMLAKILGGDGSSRLFKTVSQRKGLAYSVGSGYTNQNNSGSIYVGGSIQSTRAQETINAIFEEMKGMQEKPVSSSELDRLKRNSRYGIIKAFETNEGHIHAIETKYDKGITLKEHITKMDAVTPADVQKAAQTYLPKNQEQGEDVLMLRDPLKK